MKAAIHTLWKAAAWIFAAIGVVAGVVFFRLPWAQKFDFEILGFAWVFLNAGKLGTFLVMVLSLAFSAFLWFPVWLTR